MKSYKANSSTTSNRGIPHIIQIPNPPPRTAHEDQVSNPPFTYFHDSDSISPGSSATHDELNEMIRMVEEMKDKPAAAVYKKFGLVDNGVLCGTSFARQVSLDVSDKNGASQDSKR